MKFGCFTYVTCILILFILLLRNPYSPYNIISTLNPFPDSFHYLVSANCLLKGEGLSICREGSQIPSSVPALYPLILSAVFLFSKDPRSFYFINVILTLISVSIFYLILKKVFKKSWEIGLLSFMFVTNYIIFWYPSLAMSENLLLPLFLLSILLLLKPVSWQNSLAAGLLSISMIATKYLAISLSLSFFLLYLFKIVNSKLKKHKLIINLILLFLSSTIFLDIFIQSEYYSKGVNLLEWMDSLFSYSASFKNSLNPYVTTNTEYFSNNYFSSNFIQYLAALIGGKMRLLGLDVQIIPIMIGSIGLPVLLLSILIKNYRYIGIVLLTMLLGNLLFIVRFQVVDERYIFTSIPILIISFGIFIDLLHKYLKDKIPFSNYFIFLGVILIYLASNLPIIINQIQLNFSKKEPSYNYLAVISANNFFSKYSITEGKLPILLSVMPPYLFDFYSTHNYQIKPLSHAVYFGGSEESLNKIYGKDNYVNLIKLYETYLEKRWPVFVSDYGADRWIITKLDFEKIKNKFNMEKVASGCVNSCNIYRLMSKD